MANKSTLTSPLAQLAWRNHGLLLPEFALYFTFVYFVYIRYLCMKTVGVQVGMDVVLDRWGALSVNPKTTRLHGLVTVRAAVM
jgi:hypothetical protein